MDNDDVASWRGTMDNDDIALWRDTMDIEELNICLTYFHKMLNARAILSPYYKSCILTFIRL